TAALFDELIERLQILAQRQIDACLGAILIGEIRRLHYRKVLFFLMKNLAGRTQRLRRGSRMCSERRFGDPRTARIGIARIALDLNYRRSGNHQTNGNGCDSAAPQDTVEILEPGGVLGDPYRSTSPNDAFRLKSTPDRNPNASQGIKLTMEFLSDRDASRK